MATIAALTVGELFVSYLGQAVMLQGITEMAKDIYSTLHSYIILKCPKLLLHLEKLDIENTINNIQQLLHETKIKKESNSLKNSLNGICQMILLIKNELKKIENIVLEHHKKIFHKIRQPNYKFNLQRLELYNNLLKKRFDHFLNILKILENSNIKILNIEPLDNFNEDSYENISIEDTIPKIENDDTIDYYEISNNKKRKLI